MKRLLWLLCVAALCPLSAVGCGDDSGGGDGVEDGGVTPADLDEVNNRVNDIEDNLTGLTDDVQNLGDDLGDLSDQLDELSQDALDRLDALENPPILSCSETATCMPDGLDLVKAGVADIVEKLCSLEVDCCSPSELNYKFGPGITTVEQCVDMFTTVVNNGQSPYFLQEGGWVVQQVVGIAHALNDTSVHVELNQAGVAACLATLEDRDCDQWVEEGDSPAITNCLDYASNDNSTVQDPCYITNLVTGLEAVGEGCDPANQWGFGFTECAEGTYCQYISASCESGECDGICVELPEEGDRCLGDNDCWADETIDTELFCNRSTGECQALGDVGDDCEYIDPSFSVNNGNLNPWNNQRDATSVDCKSGLRCSPTTNKCVASCDEESLCQVYTSNYASNPYGDPTFNCPTGTICNLMANADLTQNFSDPSYNYWGNRLGICTAPIEDGEPCTGDQFNYQCASGLCAFDDGQNRYECMTVKEDGEACTTPGSDSSCRSGFCGSDSKCAQTCNCQGDYCDEESDACPSTHYCDGNTWAPRPDNQGYSYHCQPLIPDGDDCSWAWNESQDDSCVTGYCNENTVCDAKVAANAICLRDAQCPTNHYCGYDTSDDNYQCKPYLAAGANCEYTGDDLRCADGTTCVAETGNDTCQALAGLGDACDSENQGDPYCADDRDCIDVDGAAGSGTDTECYGWGEYPDGADCDDDDEYCASGWCLPNDNETPTAWNCAQPLAEGDDCDLNDQTADHCGEGLFCKYPVSDDDSRAGKCEKQGLAGDTCEPRFDGDDCLRGASCELRNDQFVCADYALEDETVFCDGQ